MKRVFTSLLLVGLSVSAFAAKDMVLQIVPKGELPTVIAPHGSVNVSYTVTNTSDTAFQGIGLAFAPTGHTPEGVSMISSVGNCLDPFDLKPGQSCNLLLLVKADNLENGKAIGGPELCSASPPPVRCSIPPKGNELNLSISEERSDQ